MSMEHKVAGQFRGQQGSRLSSTVSVVRACYLETQQDLTYLTTAATVDMIIRWLGTKLLRMLWILLDVWHMQR